MILLQSRQNIKMFEVNTKTIRTINLRQSAGFTANLENIPLSTSF